MHKQSNESTLDIAIEEPNLVVEEDDRQVDLQVAKSLFLSQKAIDN